MEPTNVHGLVTFFIRAALAVAALGGLGWIAGASPLAIFAGKALLGGGLAAAGGAALSRRLFGERRAAGLLARGLLIAVSLIVALALGELALRIVFADITSTSDNQSWFARRWERAEVVYNTLGYREVEFAKQKPSGIYRVVVIGDSFTFGQGIRDEERFAKIVERELKAEGLPVEVLTFGRPGTDTAEHLRVLREHVLDLDPDFVLLQWYTNDPPRTAVEGGPGVRPLWPHWTGQVLHAHSALYFLLNFRFMQLQRSISGPPPGHAERLAAYADPRSSEAQQYRAQLEEFIHEAAAADVRVAVVLFPHREAQVAGDYPYAPLHDLVADRFETSGAKALDLLEFFAPYDDDFAALVVNAFDAHPNALANEIAARELLHTMGPDWRMGALCRRDPGGPKCKP